jgi:modulator of FtsH protease
MIIVWGQGLAIVSIILNIRLSQLTMVKETMAIDMRSISAAELSILETNKVLKNTYMLLSATLGFSALTAMFSMSLGLSGMMPLIVMVAAMVLGIFVLPKTANSSAGIGVIFLITGMLGFAIGPMLNTYLGLSSGPQVVLTALGGTAAIFVGLSAYAVNTKKDFTFMTGMIVGVFITAVVMMIANIFLQIPALQLAISGLVIIAMSGFILMDTSRIVRGGETNYIMATYGMYLSIFNIFIHLLAILGIMSED